MLLLQLCGSETRGRLSLDLLNRKAFVAAVTSLETLPKDKTLTVKLGKEKPPIIENFDFGADYTIMENPKKTMVSAKFFGAAYSRPEDVSCFVVLLSRLGHARNLTPLPSSIGGRCVWWAESPRVHQYGCIVGRGDDFVALRLPPSLRFNDRNGQVQGPPER